MQPTIQRSADKNELIVSFKVLRSLIGILGMALPLVILVYALALNPGHQLEDSISAYYHTQMRDVLVGILCATGVFMMTYIGYTRWDRVASFLAGAFAVGVAMFPTSDLASYGTNDPLFTTVGIYKYISTAGAFAIPGIHAVNFIGTVHVVFAGGLFLTFASMSIWLFTKSSSDNPQGRKARRNTVYRVCGWLIVACVAGILLNMMTGQSVIPRTLHARYWLETIALFAFGFSWLVKGETIPLLNDKKAGPAHELLDESGPEHVEIVEYH